MISFIVWSCVMIIYSSWGLYKLFFSKKVSEKERTDIKLSFIFVAMSAIVFYFVYIY